MKQSTTYNDMPARIDEILAEIKDLKALFQSVTKREEIPKYMDINTTVAELHRQGIKMRKSTLYKKSAAGLIPVHKIDNRIYFKINELIKLYNQNE